MFILHFGLLLCFVLSSVVFADVQFWAEQIIYHAEIEQLVAEGSVRLTSQGRTLSCDRLIYQNHQLTAFNATLVEIDGSIIRSKKLICQDDLKDGFFDQVKARFEREGEPFPAQLSAQSIERLDGSVTSAHNIAYTPCKLCEVNEPTWRIRANSIVHNQDKKRIYYKHARIEVKGVPVLYTPYLAHPDPTVKRQSGFLFPSSGYSKNLGFWLRTPYFYDVDQNQDLTITPLASTKRVPGLGGLYRRNALDTAMMLGGHYAPGDQSNTIKRTGWHGQFGLRHIFRNDTDRLSIDVQRVSRVNDFTRLPLQTSGNHPQWPRDLVSQIAWNRITHNAALEARGMTFQSDSPSFQPIVHPHVRWYTELPVQGLMCEGSLLSLSRKFHSKEYYKRLERASNELRYKKHIWQQNHHYTFTASARADLYAGEQLGAKGKVHPYTSIAWGYPMRSRYVTYGTFGLQPTLMATASPRKNLSRFPNEDVHNVEYDDTAWMMPNRLQGLIDRFDDGYRLVGGAEHTWQGYGVHNPYAAFFWGPTKQLSNAPLAQKSTSWVTRLKGGTQYIEGRFRALWQKRDPLFVECGIGLNGHKTRLPLVIDTGLVRISKEIASETKPIWQWSNQVKWHMSDSWSLKANHVQHIKTSVKSRRQAVIQFYSLSYQDDCARIEVGFYRSPSSASPLLNETPYDGGNTKVVSSPSNRESASSATGIDSVDKGIMLQIVLKELGSFTPLPANIPTPSALLAR